MASRWRETVAGGLILGWVLLVAAAFWYYEFRFLRPVDPPAQAAKGPAVGQRVPPVSVGPQGGPAIELASPGTRAVYLHFWNPDCPCSRFNEATIRRLADVYQAKGIRFVILVEAPDAKRSQAMETAARAFGMPPVWDEGRQVADTLGIFTSPAGCLIDQAGTLRFRDTYASTAYCSAESRDSLERALGLMLAGRPIPSGQSPAYGCALPPS